MSDFKEKFFTTLGSVASKTKDIAEKAADVAKDIGGKTADKAKQIARIAKLNVEIGTEKDTLRKAYTEIGKLYYETHKHDSGEDFVQLCDEISLSLKTIEEKEAEIESLKSDLGDGCGDDCFEVEFEEIPVTEDEAGIEEEDSGCCCQDGEAEEAADPEAPKDGFQEE